MHKMFAAGQEETISQSINLESDKNIIKRFKAFDYM